MLKMGRRAGNRDAWLALDYYKCKIHGCASGGSSDYVSCCDDGVCLLVHLAKEMPMRCIPEHLMLARSTPWCPSLDIGHLLL
jgi:hypothetical protein